LAKLDLQDLASQLDEFEKIRITKDSSVTDMNKRFPHIAREIEKELKNHQWAKDV
jgi:hypothetical protein